MGGNAAEEEGRLDGGQDFGCTLCYRQTMTRRRTTLCGLVLGLLALAGCSFAPDDVPVGKAEGAAEDEAEDGDRPGLEAIALCARANERRSLAERLDVLCGLCRQVAGARHAVLVEDAGAEARAVATAGDPDARFVYAAPGGA